VAAGQCAPPPLPQTAFAQQPAGAWQALRHVSWQRPGGDILLTGITVRDATAMQLDDLEAERDPCFAAFATLAHAIDGMSPPVCRRRSGSRGAEAAGRFVARDQDCHQS